MKYSIEQQDPYLLLELPRDLVSTEGDDSFWSALRADLCSVVCDKPGHRVIVDLRTVEDTDTRALFQLRSVMDQVAQLVNVLYVGPGPAVGLLAVRGEAPTLQPMESTSPIDTRATEAPADDLALEELLQALNSDSMTTDLVPSEPEFHPSLGIDAPDSSAEVHFLMQRGPALPRTLATFEDDNTVVTLSWQPGSTDEVHSKNESATPVALAEDYPQGTWLELWSGEIGVIERQSGEANFLSLFERYGTSTRTVLPRRVAVSRIPKALYRAVLEKPRLSAASRNPIQNEKLQSTIALA